MRLYLDHNATTPVRPEVAEAMTQILRHEFGNPSSVYEEGAAARARVEQAREQVATLLGAKAQRVRFTSGATEANNALLFGLLEPGDHVVLSEVEHPSVSEPVALLERRGLHVSRVSPDSDGCISAADVAAALTDATRLVSVIWANNETGAIQPIESIAALCRERGILMHSDATQAVGKTAVDLSRVPIDFLSTSAHKLGGPKGVGALVVGEGVTLPAFLHGGGQERGLRGGTENVAGIVGFGLACALAGEEGAAREARWGQLRDRLWEGISSKIPGVRWNGDRERLLSNTLNVEFVGVAGEVLVQALDLEGVAVSAGAACHSGSIEPSKVLSAMGRTPEQARGSLRFSVGHGVDEGQIDALVGLLGTLVPRVRSVQAP